MQEENKILDKMNRQKVSEVERLTQTVRELEEAILAGGTAANIVRDYERRMQEINEEKKILDRELARAKISANRVAVVIANDWKDANSKVMPVKQWLEERRVLQGEMQHLREKLTVAERTAKAETQLKNQREVISNQRGMTVCFVSDVELPKLKAIEDAPANPTTSITPVTPLKIKSEPLASQKESLKRQAPVDKNDAMKKLRNAN